MQSISAEEMLHISLKTCQIIAKYLKNIAQIANAVPSHNLKLKDKVQFECQWLKFSMEGIRNTDTEFERRSNFQYQCQGQRQGK